MVLGQGWKVRQGAPPNPGFGKGPKKRISKSQLNQPMPKEDLVIDVASTPWPKAVGARMTLIAPARVQGLEFRA